MRETSLKNNVQGKLGSQLRVSKYSVQQALTGRKFTCFMVLRSLLPTDSIISTYSLDDARKIIF